MKKCNVKKRQVLSVFSNLLEILKYYSRQECGIAEFTDNGVQIKNGIKQNRKIIRYLSLERLQLPTMKVREKKI